MYLNCRPWQTLGHAEPDDGEPRFLNEPTPPHVKRAILFLSDMTEETSPFRYTWEDGTSERIYGRAGLLWIFDGHRANISAQAVARQPAKFMDFIIAPRSQSQVRRVIAGGMNHWPLDPFIFSVHDLTASPPFTESPVLINPFTG